MGINSAFKGLKGLVELYILMRKMLVIVSFLKDVSVILSHYQVIIEDQKQVSFQYNYIFFTVALRPNAGHGLLILEVSRSHTTTHHSR